MDSEFLKTRRKYVIVIIFATAALLTPPDPITQIGLAIPLLALWGGWSVLGIALGVMFMWSLLLFNMQRKRSKHGA